MIELVPANGSDTALIPAAARLVLPERDGGGGWSHEACLTGICHDCAS